MNHIYRTNNVIYCTIINRLIQAILPIRKIYLNFICLYAKLREDIEVNHRAASDWLNVLESFYCC
jgi:hypothetical protein